MSSFPTQIWPDPNDTSQQPATRADIAWLEQVLSAQIADAAVAITRTLREDAKRASQAPATEPPPGADIVGQ